MTTLEERAATRREANVVAHMLHGGISLHKKTCWQCDRKFMATADFMNLCSDRCLSLYLDGYGITWYPEATPQERWEFEAPARLAPETLEELIVWATKLIKYTSS